MGLIKNHTLWKGFAKINKKMTLQWKALFLLAVFLVIMAVLTVVSKHADEYITPQVTTQTLTPQVMGGTVYRNCVPLKALHKDGMKRYVLVVSKTKTELGTETVAERVYVSVVHKNNQFASLDDALTTSQQIILNSNKSVGPGDRIKVRD